MNFKTIYQSITIEASKEKVWSVLFEDHYSRLWYAEFSPGTHAVTDWKEESKALFIDDKGDGLLGKIIVNKPYEKLSIEYQGEVRKGIEDANSPAAQVLKGGLETYTLVEEDRKTLLSIAGDMSDDYFDVMFASWTQALKKIKELAESN
ncbi:MAG: SRPBCC domain-containing protein [Cytophagaceae bacterium]|nr:SRPBCC domain-containing protein [Cytophagaceae bacterium]